MTRLIDADYLIDDIEHNLWDWESVDGITASTVLKQTITDIKNQPTVEPVRHGRWKPFYPELDLYVCSECGGISVGETNYCHRCGSRNREENDENR